MVFSARLLSAAAMAGSAVGAAATWSILSKDKAHDNSTVPQSLFAAPSTEAAILRPSMVETVSAQLSAGPPSQAPSSTHQAAMEKLKRAKEVCSLKMVYKLYEYGAPGMAVAVAVDGKLVWAHGYGYSDLEQHTLMRSSTVMRIASISKAITMAAVGRLIEEGKLDVDKPVTEYVKAWPDTHPTMTTRQLVSHTAGVRHYLKKGDKVDDESDAGDAKYAEFRSKEKFDSVESALNIFKNDELLSSPGEAFNYTTHGFTLVSAVIEAASGEPFPSYMKKLFRDLGLRSTYLDENEPLVLYRSRHYVRDRQHRLRNAPYVDNSCKWAGGGFLSSVQDLVKFGTAMLYSYQKKDDPQEANAIKEVDFRSELHHIDHQVGPYDNVNGPLFTKNRLPGFLKSETMRQLWTPVTERYALGWAVQPRLEEKAFCREERFHALHTGGAVGATSVLLVLPRESREGGTTVPNPPQGVVVAILCNLESASGLATLALEIAKEFEKLPPAGGPHVVHKLHTC